MMRGFLTKHYQNDFLMLVIHLTRATHYLLPMVTNISDYSTGVNAGMFSFSRNFCLCVD